MVAQVIHPVVGRSDKRLSSDSENLETLELTGSTRSSSPLEGLPARGLGLTVMFVGKYAVHTYLWTACLLDEMISARYDMHDQYFFLHLLSLLSNIRNSPSLPVHLRSDRICNVCVHSRENAGGYL